MTTRTRLLRTFGLIGLLALGITPCVAAPGDATSDALTATDSNADAAPAPPTDPAGLQERVEARWQALIDGDLPRAYSYLTPGYRTLYPLESYFRSLGSKVKWLGIDVVDIEIDGQRAVVTLTLRYRLQLPPQAGFEIKDDLTTQLTETWLWREGEWWFVNEGGIRL